MGERKEKGKVFVSKIKTSMKDMRLTKTKQKHQESIKKTSKRNS